MSSTTSVLDGGSDVSLNGPSRRGWPIIRVLGLPISLTRAKVVAAVSDLLDKNGIVSVLGRVLVVRKKTGEVHARIFSGTSRIYDLVKVWGADLGAGVVWEKVGYRPPNRLKLVHTPPKRFRVASWNINGLRSKRASIIERILELRMSVVALQETKVGEADWPICISGFQVFTSPMDVGVPGARGLAIAVSTFYSSYLAQAGPFWIYVKVLGAEESTWHIINVYIPHDKGGRRLARKSLKTKVGQILSHDRDAKIMVLGDFNCGRNRAQCLFPSASGMKLVSIKGSDKTYHKRLKWSVLDHIIVSDAAVMSVGKAKVRRDVDESDHFPIVIRVKTATRKPLIGDVGGKLSVDRKLLDKKGGEISLDQEWTDWLESIQEGIVGDLKDNIDQAAKKWETISNRLLTKHQVLVEPKLAAKKKLPKSVLMLIGHKREAWAEYLQGDEGDEAQRYERYRRARRLAIVALAQYRSLRWVKFIQKGSESFVENNTRRFFKWVDSLTKYRGFGGSSIRPIKDDEGVMVYDTQGVLDLWADHFKKILVGGLHSQRDRMYWEQVGGLEIQSALPGMDEDLSWIEVQEALRGLRNFKAPGVSGLLPEFYKIMIDDVGDDGPPLAPTSPMQKVFATLVNLIWSEGYIPIGWTTDILVTVEKKGDLSSRDGYRGVALIEIFIKVITRCASTRISMGLENNGRIAPEQAGFRRREECMGQVLTLMEVVRRRNAKKLGTIILFIDFKKAYDLVPREALLYKLEACGVRGKTLAFLEGIYARSFMKVRVGGILANEFQVFRGCRQGCAASPISFDVFINDLVLELRVLGILVPSVQELLSALLFADDLAIVVDSVEKLGQACDVLTAWAAKWEMAVGISKCGVMVPDSPALCEEVKLALDSGVIMIQNQVPPKVEEYDYLGVLLTESDFSGLERHMEERIKKFQVRWKKLEPFLRTQSIPLKSRKHVLNVVALPVLKWGSELLGPSEKSIRKMESAYSDALKCLVGSRSRNTIYAIESIRLELGVPSFHEIVLKGRLRVLVKYPDLNTWVAKIAVAPELKEGKSHFWKTLQWYKRYPRVEVPDPRAHTKLEEYFHDKHAALRNATVSLVRYKEFGFLKSNYFLTDLGYRVEFAKGCVWLCRARLNGIWTARRAAKMNLIDPTLEYKCPACLMVIGDNAIKPNELGHILFECMVYASCRDMLDPLVAMLVGPMDVENKVGIILGGSRNNNPNPWTVQQWTGQGGKVLEGQGSPGYTFVAKFLDRVMPLHMRALWEFRVVD